LQSSEPAPSTKTDRAVTQCLLPPAVSVHAVSVSGTKYDFAWGRAHAMLFVMPTNK
jgi:hypothetical protein